MGEHALHAAVRTERLLDVALAAELGGELDLVRARVRARVRGRGRGRGRVRVRVSLAHRLLAPRAVKQPLVEVDLPVAVEVGPAEERLQDHLARLVYVLLFEEAQELVRLERA